MADRKPNLTVAAVLAWLVPGAGHFLVLDLRAKGVLYFVLILGTFVAGLLLSDFHALRMERQHDLYFAAYCWLGLPTAVTMIATDSLRVTGFIDHEALGLLYCSTAGLLNLLAIADVFSAAERRASAGEEAEA